MEKTKSPQSNNLLRPNLSPNAPAVMRRPDNTNAYALIIHNCYKLDGFKSRIIVGITAYKTVASIDTKSKQMLKIIKICHLNL
ncbi:MULTISPECIES: hypothetical protein [spotted fever group]|uniref:Uncharacterized protein n=1 Tax=Rickettsia philipii (strain 364D) TaxID=481009 RepID=H6PV82_RICP3|nr:hypothetical protein [Rickettsia philipii]AFB26779.1 hypothetical protein RSA_06525 [Rickettsia philipii str. 364D]